MKSIAYSPRHAFNCVMQLIAIGALSTGAWAVDLDQTVDFNIPKQRLDSALVQFSEQAKIQITTSNDEVKDLSTDGIIGQFRLAVALKALLQNTGLSYRSAGRSAISIGRFSPSTSQTLSPSQTVGHGPETGELQGNPTSQREQITEIIVTAQKRTERLQDVPIPVSVLSADTLADNNQTRILDFYNQIPGLNITGVGAASVQLLIIRGITTGIGTNPTVGITVDDVPFGGSTTVGGDLVPDLDPADLARVEVLRGPQGTLYGASSMGGLVKFVTADPSTDAVSGRVEAGTNSVYNGGGLGYTFRASVNLPLSDTLAIRASGFTREDPGYIDNPVTHVNGVNEDHANGGRLAALWRPSDAVSLKVSALYQTIKAEGNSDVIGAGLADLQQNYIPGTGAYDRKTQAYSAILNAKLGSINLTALTGYNTNGYKDSQDATYFAGPITSSVFPGITGSPILDDSETKKFTQEVRLSASIGRQFDWLVGAFFTHETTSDTVTYLAENAVTGAVVGQGFYGTFPTTYQEYAGFADVTYHVTDRFDIQFGARDSEITTTNNPETEIGPYDGPCCFFFGTSPVVVPESSFKANAFTYLLTPQFKVSSGLMVYARLASGYRAGGTNGFSAASNGIPAGYKPDKTQNYEVGVKGDFLDHTLSVDASVYYIDWKDIQLSVATPNYLYYNGNAGRAKSEGVELSVESKPLTGLTIAGWITLTDAALTEPFPVGPPNSGLPVAASGDTLPYSSRFSGNFSLQQEFPLTSRLTGYVGGAVSYVGARLGQFISTPQRQDYPSYAQANLRGGVKYESWTANFYANNVADRRGVTGGGVGTSYNPGAFTYIQPRTIGLNVAKAF
jgi:iron complex outermembrane receptor protein